MRSISWSPDYIKNIESIVCSSYGQYTDDPSLSVGSNVIILEDVEEWLEQGRKPFKGLEGVVCYIREDKFGNCLYGIYIVLFKTVVDFFSNEISAVFDKYELSTD